MSILVANKVYRYITCFFGESLKLASIWDHIVNNEV